MIRMPTLVYTSVTFCTKVPGMHHKQTSRIFGFTCTGTTCKQKSAPSKASLALVVAKTFSGSMWFGKYFLQ